MRQGWSSAMALAPRSGVGYQYCPGLAFSSTKAPLIKAIVSSADTANQTTADYVLCPEVLLLLLEDGTARLLDLDGDSYALSPTAATMLGEALRCEVTTIARGIAARYGIDQRQAEADTRAFLSQLEQKELIRRVRPTATTVRSTPPPRWVLTLLRMIHAWPTSLSSQATALLTVAYCANRWSGWTGALGAWRCYYSRQSLSPGDSSNPQIGAIDQAVRTIAARHPLKIGCKERALCSWGLARVAGQPAKLILGVELFPMACHCWCQLGPRIIGDDEERCVRFTPVADYD